MIMAPEFAYCTGIIVIWLEIGAGTVPSVTPENRNESDNEMVELRESARERRRECERAREENGENGRGSIWTSAAGGEPIERTRSDEQTQSFQIWRGGIGLEL